MTSLCLLLQEAASQHCSRCHDANSRQREMERQLSLVEQTLKNDREVCDGHCKYITELESSLDAGASHVNTQVSS